MIELPVLAKLLSERFPDIGEFELRPHKQAVRPHDDTPPGLTLHLIAPLSEAERVDRIAAQVQEDPELRAAGINDVAFTLWGEREYWR